MLYFLKALRTARKTLSVDVSFHVHFDKWIRPERESCQSPPCCNADRVVYVFLVVLERILHTYGTRLRVASPKYFVRSHVL